MAGAVLRRDAEYVANVKADIIQTAERLLTQKYASIAAYGLFAVFLMIGAVYAAYKVYFVVFRYVMEVEASASYTINNGDNVDDPKHDNVPRAPDSDDGVSRVPSGNQIRNRIAEYSKGAGRDLRSDFDDANDEYEKLSRRKDEEEDEDD
jgi:hypothetical protein